MIKLKKIIKSIYSTLTIFAILNNENKKNINKLNKKNKKKHQYFSCSQCKHIITFENPQNKDIFIDCPICSKKGIVGYSNIKETPPLIKKLGLKNNNAKFNNNNILYYKPLIRIKNIGLIFIVFGMIFLANPTLLNIKLSSTFIIIGCIILALIPNTRYFFMRIKNSQKKKTKTLITKFKINNSMKNKLNNLKYQFDVSEKIAIAIIILIIFLFIITGVNNFEIFLIFIYLGILIIRELSNEFLPILFKKRMNIFIIIFLMIFIVFLIKRVINVIYI